MNEPITSPMPPKIKKPYFLRDVIIFAVVAIIAFQIYSYYNALASQVAYKQEEKAQINNLEERYDFFENKFREPQKVVSAAIGKLELEDNIYVSFSYQMADAFDYGKQDAFDKYAQENLIGQEVTVVLPPKDDFLMPTMFLYADDSLGSEYLNATVYFKGESLNEKFGFIDPNNK